MKQALLILFLSFFFMCSCSENSEDKQSGTTDSSGTTTTTTQEDSSTDVSKPIVASEGGELTLSDGTTFTIDPNSLSEDTTISIKKSQEDTGLTFDLEPSGTIFSTPAKLSIPITEKSDTLFNVQMYSEQNEVRDLGSETTQFATLNTNRVGDSIEVEIPHFSLVTASYERPVYVVMHIPGKYLKRGDLIYVLTGGGNWDTGHTGLYLGTTDYNDSIDINDGETIVESSPPRVQFSTLNTFKTEYSHLYMGAMRPYGGLTDVQREKIATFAITAENVGTQYWPIDNYTGFAYINELIGYISGLVSGAHMTCVELTESSYVFAGKSLVSISDRGLILLPIKQYVEVVPVDEITVIEGEAIGFKITGVAKPLVGGQYQEIPATGTVRTDLGMSFENNYFSWSSPTVGTYNLVFQSTAEYQSLIFSDKQTLTASQSLKIVVVENGDTIDSGEDDTTGDSDGSSGDTTTDTGVPMTSVSFSFDKASCATNTDIDITSVKLYRQNVDTWTVNDQWELIGTYTSPGEYRLMTSPDIQGTSSNGSVGNDSILNDSSGSFDFSFKLTSIGEGSTVLSKNLAIDECSTSGGGCSGQCTIVLSE